MIVDLLRTRRSTRRFDDRPIPDHVLQDVLEAGRLSPSGGNEQPWRFGVVRERAQIRRIAASSCGQDWIAAAPLVIVLCAVITEGERGGRDIQAQRFPQLAEPIETMDRVLYAALNLEEHQTKIPGTHMVLAALERGVGATWVSRFDVGEVARILGLPEDCVPSEMLVMGYPAAAGAARAKKPVSELAFLDRWSDRDP